MEATSPADSDFTGAQTNHPGFSSTKLITGGLIPVSASDSNGPSEAMNTENEPPKKPTAAKTFQNVISEIKALVAINHMRNDGRPQEIVPGLYLGSVGAALSKKILLELQITDVLSVMDKMKTPFPDQFRYRQIEIFDSVDDDIQKHFVESTQHMHDCITKNGKILVHCFAGKSRSSTMVCAYMMKYHNMSRDTALAHIKERRPIICPNMGFMKQLLAWEKQLYPDGAPVSVTVTTQQVTEMKAE
jgi:protein-tyrosine phosphatase